MFIRLDLTNRPDCNYNHIISVLSRLGKKHNIGIFQPNEEYIAQEYLKKHGNTFIVDNFSLENYLTEQFIPKGTNAPDIVQQFYTIFNEFQSQDATKLIVIDPYLFPPNADAAYQNLLVDIISYFTKLTEILFVTSSGSKHYDANLYLSISSKLNITPSLKINNKWHDRFWIIDDLKGLFVGSSMNGIGKKHSVISKLDSADVIEILGEI